MQTRIEVLEEDGSVRLCQGGTTTKVDGLPARILQALAVTDARKATLSGPVGGHARGKLSKVVAFDAGRWSWKTQLTTDVQDWYDDRDALTQLTEAEALAFIDRAERWITPAKVRPEAKTRVLDNAIAAAEADRVDALTSLVQLRREAHVRNAAARALKRLGAPVPETVGTCEGRWLTAAQMTEPGVLVGRDGEVEELLRHVRDSRDSGGIVALCGPPCMGRNHVASTVLTRLRREGFDVAVVGADADAAALELARGLRPDEPPLSADSARACVLNELGARDAWCVLVDAATRKVEDIPELSRIQGGAWIVLSEDRVSAATAVVELGPLGLPEIEKILIRESGGRLDGHTGVIAPMLGGSPSLAVYTAQLMTRRSMGLEPEDIIEALRNYNSAQDVVSDAVNLVAQMRLGELGGDLPEIAGCLALLSDDVLPDEFVVKLADRPRRQLRPLRELASNPHLSLAMLRPIALALRSRMSEKDVERRVRRIGEAISSMASRHPVAEEHEPLIKMVPHVSALLHAVKRHPVAAASLVPGLLAITEAQWSRGMRSAAMKLLEQSVEVFPQTAPFAEVALHQAELLQDSGEPGDHLATARGAAKILSSAATPQQRLRIDGGLARIARAAGDLPSALEHARAAHRLACQTEFAGASQVDRALSRRHLAEVLQDLDVTTPGALEEAHGLVVEALEDLAGIASSDTSEARISAAVDALKASPSSLRFNAVSVLRVGASVERAAGQSLRAATLLEHAGVLRAGMSVHDSRWVKVLLLRGLVELDGGNVRAREVADDVIAIASGDAASAPALRAAHLLKLECGLLDLQRGFRTERVAAYDAAAGAAERWADEPWSHAVVACLEAVDPKCPRDNAHAAAAVLQAAETVSARRGDTSQAALKLERLRWTLVASEDEAGARDALARLDERAGSVGEREHREAGMIAMTRAWLTLLVDPPEARKLARRAAGILERTVGKRAAMTLRAHAIVQEAGPPPAPTALRGERSSRPDGPGRPERGDPSLLRGRDAGAARVSEEQRGEDLDAL